MKQTVTYQIGCRGLFCGHASIQSSDVRLNESQLIAVLIGHILQSCDILLEKGDDSKLSIQARCHRRYIRSDARSLLGITS